MSLYKRFALKGALAGVLIAATAIAGSVLFSGKPVQATDAGDCGPSSIITCGVKSVPEIISKYNTNATVHGTFNAFGINDSDLQKLNSHAVLGTVYEDFFDGHDVVVVGDKIVAVNAVTAGRVYVNGSTLLGNFGGVNIYKRPYHLSNHRPKQAFVYMENGVFQFGVLAECGNPITGDTPKIKMDKEISKDGVNFSENATFKDGEKATFRITVKETNGGFANNVFVKDKVPAGYKYVKGSTKVDGKKVADITEGKVDLGVLGPLQTKVVTFEATVHLEGKVCGTNRIPNTAIVNSDETPPQDDDASATVTKDCVAKCDSLNGPSEVGEDKKATYTAKATVKNVTVTKYVFSVDGKKVQSGMNDKYEYTANELGTHTIAVVVHFSDGTKDGGDGNCAKKVETKEKVRELKCESLTPKSARLKVGEDVTFTAKGVSTNVKITGYIFRVNGDIVKETDSAKEDTYKFKATKAGDYTVKVFVKGEGQKPVSSDDCEAKVKVTVVKVELNCDSLKASKGRIKVGETSTLTVKGSAKNTKITGYIFRQNGTVVKESNSEADNKYEFTPTAAGTYKFKATVKGENGDTADSKDCEVTVQVEELKCDSLKASKTTVKPNEKVTLTVKGSAKNTKITGYIFRQDGKVVKDTNAEDKNTYVFQTATPGTYKFKATVKGENDARANSPECEATINVSQIPQKEVVCDLLSASKTNVKPNEEVTFTGQGTATNTTITGYIFTVDGVVAKETNSAADNTFVFKNATAKEYTVRLTVKGAEGQRATNDTTCVKKVTVTDVTQPAYTCELLKVTPSNLKINTKTVAEVTFTAENGATFKSASFNFGDGSSPVLVTTASGNKATAEHTYTKNGTYSANVTLTFQVDGDEKVVVGSTSNGCAQTVNVSDVCKYNPNLPPESEDCFEPCPYPGKEDYPKDDENCVAPELPKTGAGSMVGLFTATSFIGAAVYRMRLARGNQ